MSHTTMFAVTGTNTLCTAAQAAPTTLATAVAVANPTPKSIDYPSLDITKSAEQASKPSYADSTTIIVDKDEAWEAEYLKAMEQAMKMRNEYMSGKKRCSRDGKKRACTNFCGQLL